MVGRVLDWGWLGVYMLSRRVGGRAALGVGVFAATLGGHALGASAFGYTSDNPVAVGVACAVAAFIQAGKERQVGRQVAAPLSFWSGVRARALDALGAAILVYVVAGLLHLMGQTHPVWLALGMAAVGFSPGGSTEALFVWVFRRGEEVARQRAGAAVPAAAPVPGVAVPAPGGVGPNPGEAAAGPPAPAQGEDGKQEGGV